MDICVIKTKGKTLDNQDKEAKISRWGLDFPHPSKPILRPTKPPMKWLPGVFYGTKAPVA
jgi:hypothetical protein